MINDDSLKAAMLLGNHFFSWRILCYGGGGSDFIQSKTKKRIPSHKFDG